LKYLNGSKEMSMRAFQLLFKDARLLPKNHRTKNKKPHKKAAPPPATATTAATTAATMAASFCFDPIPSFDHQRSIKPAALDIVFVRVTQAQTKHGAAVLAFIGAQKQRKVQQKRQQDKQERLQHNKHNNRNKKNNKNNKNDSKDSKIDLEEGKESKETKLKHKTKQNTAVLPSPTAATMMGRAGFIQG